ncbi:PPC domain-containing DNA-binding protein [Picrophilus oshimae]|uniref:DNA-binding protein n=1 Tax=Picrophilus torridus (strain ATCC 700027 / DSM 9790 / JCM 10055 / NBRC 100828 / KAW 2/3) TaxID=1122961 RepID=Q6L112_PICTO|nr:DUF296 domain-containing protein [Picrophilus oshimae]AAT43340.1 putative DNA-binding protein [Picrophilus oshimae DSM 9789]
MQHKIENNVIFAKFESGEDIINDLDSLVSFYKIRSASIDFAIGMMKNARFAYWNIDHYDETFIDERIELVSFHGSIADDEIKYHIHMAGAKNDHRIYGGHFISGIADPLMELRITVFNDIKLKRSFNDDSHLREIKID